MNLPPVPGSPLPPPPPAGTNLPPVPPPPPSPGAAPSPVLSHRAKIILGLGTVLLIAFAVIAGLRAPPSDEAIRLFLTDRLAHEGLDVLNCQVKDRVTAADHLSVTVEVYGTQRAGKSYVDIGADEFGGVGGITGGGAGKPAEDEPAFDFAEWRRIKELLTGRNGPRLIELASLTAEAGTLAKLTLVREITRTDTPTQLTTVVRAERQGVRWKFSRPEPTATGAGTGEHLRSIEAFPGPVYVLNRPADRDRIIALARLLPDLGARLDRAITTLLAERKSSVLELLKPHVLFAGTAEMKASNKPEKARIFLEITEVRGDEEPVRLTAVLHNDGGGDAKRLFSGEVLFAPATGVIQLQLTSPSDANGEESGPFLANNYPGIDLETDSDNNVLLPLAIENQALVGMHSGYALRLEPVPAAARAAVLAEMAGDEPLLLAATKPGLTYTGTITNRLQGTREKFLLRFPAREKNTPEPAAVLEHPEHATWKCGFKVALDPNRYSAKGNPLQLHKSFGDEFDPPAEMIRCFESGDQEAVFALHLDGNKLAGENSRFIFRFEPATPQFLAEREQAQAAREARLLDLIRPGAGYEGTAQRAGGVPVSLRLRFMKVENRGEKIEAILESVPHPETGWLLKGQLNLATGTLQFMTNGASRPGASMSNDNALLPGLSPWGSKLTLVLDANTLTGSHGASDNLSKLNFPLNP